MRIEPGKLQSLNIKAPAAGENLHIRNGQQITGRVVPGSGGTVQIITLDGYSITALVREGAAPAMEGLVTFEAAGTEDGMVLLRVVGQGLTAPGGEALQAGLAAELGISGNQEMLEFLKKGRFVFSKNVERLFYLLGENGRPDLIDRLLNMFMGQDRLLEYLRAFRRERGRKFLDKLDKLFEEIKNSGLNERAFERAAEGTLKGLLLQFNHPFPLFYIPLPVMHQGSMYTGEMWMEEDGSGGQYYIHLFIDTESFGRVEADIGYDSRSMSVDMFCSREAMAALEPYTRMLKDRLSSLGATLGHFELDELKRKRGFTDLAAKYISTVPLDVRV